MENIQDLLVTEKAKSYNLGYTHGLEDLKMRALIELWNEVNKMKNLDPDLATLLKLAIARIEKLK